MNRYLFLFSLLLFSLMAKSIVSYNSSDQSVANIDVKQMPNSPAEAEIFLAKHFDHNVLVTQFDERILAFNISSLEEIDALDKMEKSQNLEVYRLHSISITPSHQVNKFDVFVTYATR
jgi:hypothetical protein